MHDWFIETLQWSNKTVFRILEIFVLLQCFFDIFDTGNHQILLYLYDNKIIIVIFLISVFQNEREARQLMKLGDESLGRSVTKDMHTYDDNCEFELVNLVEFIVGTTQMLDGIIQIICLVWNGSIKLVGILSWQEQWNDLKGNQDQSGQCRYLVVWTLFAETFIIYIKFLKDAGNIQYVDTPYYISVPWIATIISSSGVYLIMRVKNKRIQKLKVK
ncbi:unnamed protein product [Paramecium octaurelia]|uniref:Uncharacterized protein n=1 Tax=Paramecium octaurelia TaxID=43137 RepID=A0A8S1VBJ5_PAROT|nr:unnamed protein product [Paramecium octaurelia]